jgi:hypothetical protein
MTTSSNRTEAVNAIRDGLTPRRRSRWWLALAIPALAAALSLTGPTSPAAAAVPDRQIVSASSASTSENKGIDVACPEGTQRLAAGADVGGGGSPYVVIDDLIPGPRNVTAYGYEYYYGTSETWSIRVWAVCGRLSTTVHTYSRSSPYDIDPSKSVSVSCPGSEVVLGTGYSLLHAGGNALVYELTPTSSSVTVSAWAVDLGSAGGWSVAAYAICAEDPGGRSQSSSETLSTSESKNGSASCPEDKEALGAGFELNGFRGRLNYDDLIPTNVGTVLTHANELVATTNTWSVKTHVICVTG